MRHPGHHYHPGSRHPARWTTTPAGPAVFVADRFQRPRKRIIIAAPRRPLAARPAPAPAGFVDIRPAPHVLAWFRAQLATHR